MTTENACAKIAFDVVERAGGSITFEEYDSAMAMETYFTPINWIAGWGLSRADKKANDDKQCAFAACRLGLLRQTNTG